LEKRFLLFVLLNVNYTTDHAVIVTRPPLFCDFSGITPPAETYAPERVCITDFWITGFNRFDKSAIKHGRL